MRTNSGDRLPELQTATRWEAFLARVERVVEARGEWTGEARDIRDAAGIRRFGPANWARVTGLLAERNLEVDPPGRPYESDPVWIRPAGWAAWEACGRLLAERLADAERRVPKIALWRDRVVLATAIGEWAGQMRRDGWVLRRVDEPS